METILIKCPHCGEEMQAPKGRESILCMFCGVKIDLSKAEMPAQIAESADSAKKAALTPAEYQENLNFAISHAGAVCKNYAEKVRAFKKNTYPELFQGHKEENFAFYHAVKLVLSAASPEESDSICHRIADAFIAEQKQTSAELPKKNAKYAAQMDKNMFLVIYVLPAIKDLQLDKADRLAEVICEDWRKAFKDSNIAPADFASINGGFKRKLCYVTTAVCRNLNKGEDCETLRLIKDFRDGYLSSTEDGQALIEEYYDIAPTLVKRIDKDLLAQEKYLYLWNTYLLPCVAYIKSGLQENCRETYCSMMEELKSEYMYHNRQKG